MDTGGSSKHDSLWMQGTRRNTRSSSNQDKETREKVASSASEVKGQDQSSDVGESKKKDNLGQIVRGQNNEVVEYITEDGLSYKIFDSVYIATERPDHPYSIGTIQEIKVSKKDYAVVVVKWYYRPCEVPVSVYQMLVKERLDSINNQPERDLILNTESRNRELFLADDDIMDMFPVSSLRGKCSVERFSSFQEVKGYDLISDSFFYILGYNPETRRLSSAHGEVRVGPSHQWSASARGFFQKAVIPDLLSPIPPAEERVNPDYEELMWEPKVNDGDLIMYLRSARSMAAFAGMCDGGSPEEGCVVASRDETTVNALSMLFQSNGDVRAALQALVKKPLPITVERKWTEDQVKRFQKGLRQNGKNFYKIRKDQLPGKDTSELVEFYYLWKKVQENLMIQPQGKNRRQAVLKRNSKQTTNVPDAGCGGSSSDIESESDESDKDSTNFICSHCGTTTSEDWNVGGKENVLLCSKCQILFKKYGNDTQLEIDFNNDAPSDVTETESRSPIFLDPPSEVQPPPFMFKPIKEKLSGETQEVTNDEKVPDIKKLNKRPWKPHKALSDKSDVDEKRIKSEIKSENLSPKKSNDNTVDEENTTWNDNSTKIVKVLKKESEASTSMEEGLPLNPILAAGYPPYPQYPMSYPTHPIVHPTPQIDTPAKKSESDEKNKVEHRNSSNPTKPDEPQVHPSAYQSPKRHPFYLPRAPMIPAHPPVSTQPDLKIPANPHTHTWSNPSKSNGETPGVVTSQATPIRNPPSHPAVVKIEQPDESRTEQRPFLPPGGVHELQKRGDSSIPERRRSPHPVAGDNHKIPPPEGRYRREEKPVVDETTKQADPLSRLQLISHSNQRPSTPQGQTSSNEQHRIPIPARESSDSPSEVICTSDEIPLPIYPEHHATILAGQPWPANLQLYDDGLPQQDRSKGPLVRYTGRKVRLSGYPGSLCSRTDFAWICPPEHKTPHKQDRPAQQQTKQQTDKQQRLEKEIIKPKSREERPLHANEPVTIKREPSRLLQPHSRPPAPQHTPHLPPHSATRSTPTRARTPTPGYEGHKPPPHSSPFGNLGPDASASRTLRQYATDSQRETMMSHTQALYPYHSAQSERDLRERELRERELRDRLPKQTLDSMKLLETIDPQMSAMAMQGMHLGMVPGLPMNPQALDQIRQHYPANALIGVPGAHPVVPGAIPGFHPMLTPNPELQLHQNAEIERMATEHQQRMHAELAAREHQYRMDLLHSHQHSHVHSHVHLHPQNAQPHPASVLPPNVPTPDTILNPYAVMALQAQTQQAIAAGVDPLHAASMNQMLNIGAIRGPPAIMPPPGMSIHHPALPGRPDSLLLSASHHLQAVAHEQNILVHQRAVQDDYMMRLGYVHKP